MGQMIKRTDAQFQQDVLQELRWDTRVKETDVGVEVDRGIVTLTGTVDSWAARLAAQDAAHRVAGVLDVANDLRVKLPTSTERTDADIEQIDTCARLIDGGLRLGDRCARLRVVDLHEQAARLHVLAFDGPDRHDQPGNLGRHLNASLHPDASARDDVLLQILPDGDRRLDLRPSRAERPDDERARQEDDGDPETRPPQKRSASSCTGL